MFDKGIFYFLLLLVCSSTMVLSQVQKTPSSSSKDVFISRYVDTTQGSQPYFLVHLKKGTRKFDLVRNKVDIVRYLDHGYAIIKSNQIKPGKHTLFDTVLYTNPLWKFSEGILSQDRFRKSEYSVGVSNESGHSVARILSSHSEIKILTIRKSTLIVHCSVESLLKYVIPISDVHYVGQESFKPNVESRVLDLNLEPNTINRIHHVYPELNGEGITISIKEEAYNPEDIDLDGRHVASTLSAPEIDNHATEMATIAAGAGNSFVTGRGVAKASYLTSSNFTPVFPDEDEDYQLLNVGVQNHSYGTVIENVYGILAEAFDQSANRNPNLLHIFSSGNKGNETSASGVYQGVQNFANLTGNFKMAKNILVVGSVDTVGREVSLSSRGPTHDGRIKPEIVAYSTAGTSNSAALVSGMVLLLQQTFKQSTGQLPPSALVKALLINSAQDAGLPGIDFVTGYGNADSYRSVQNLISERYSMGSVNQGETNNVILPVPVNARNLKVTLVWNDPAATPNTNKTLINDLDIVLTDPSNSAWLPWTLDATPSVNNLRLPAIRDVDHVNNVEQVTINVPEPGDYTISITGFDIPAGPQQYFVAYQWDTVDQFDWSFPSGSDNMPFNGESAGYFRWKSTLAEEFGQLEYSVNNGDTWQLIKGNVELKKGFYRWLPPEINTAALARMVVGTDSYVTDQFTISRPIEVQVGFNCADSVMLQWNPVSGATEYDVQTFNETYLESIQITTDTTIILNKGEFPSRFYAVQPVFPGAVRMIRSYTFDYALQGVDCFIRNFYLEVSGINGVFLKLQLGTAYSVNEIFFERENNGVFEIIGSVIASGNSFFQFLDDQPKQGNNIYRARILLDNGEEVITEVNEFFFLTETPYVVFPNPVLRSSGLYVFANQLQTAGALLRLYKTDGRLVLTQQLISDREVINIKDMNPGLYFYSIESNRRIHSGKILIADD